MDDKCRPRRSSCRGADTTHGPPAARHGECGGECTQVSEAPGVTKKPKEPKLTERVVLLKHMFAVIDFADPHVRRRATLISVSAHASVCVLTTV